MSKRSKGKKKGKQAPAPKSTHASRRKQRRKTKITKVTKETREVRSNPGGVSFGELGEVVLPAFAGFAGTKIVQRVTFSIVSKKWPKFAKHAGVLGALASFAGILFFGHKVKAIEKYRDGAMIGSGVAALHSVATAYLPRKYNWLLSDPTLDDAALPAPSPSQNTAAPTPTTTASDEYSYLEDQLTEMERGGSRAARTVPAPRPAQAPIAAAMAMATQNQDDGATVDPDLMEALEPGEDVDDLYRGAFSTN